MTEDIWKIRLNNILSSPKIKNEYWKIVQIIVFKNNLALECRGFDAYVNAIRILKKFGDIIPEMDKKILELIIEDKLTNNFLEEYRELKKEKSKKND